MVFRVVNLRAFNQKLEEYVCVVFIPFCGLGAPGAFGQAIRSSPKC